MAFPSLRGGTIQHQTRVAHANWEPLSTTLNKTASTPTNGQYSNVAMNSHAQGVLITSNVSINVDMTQASVTISKGIHLAARVPWVMPILPQSTGAIYYGAASGKGIFQLTWLRLRQT